MPIANLVEYLHCSKLVWRLQLWAASIPAFYKVGTLSSLLQETWLLTAKPCFDWIFWILHHYDQFKGCSCKICASCVYLYVFRKYSYKYMFWWMSILYLKTLFFTIMLCNPKTQIHKGLTVLMTALPDNPIGSVLVVRLMFFLFNYKSVFFFRILSSWP